MTRGEICERLDVRVAAHHLTEEGETHVVRLVAACVEYLEAAVAVDDSRDRGLSVEHTRTPLGRRIVVTATERRSR
jgi:hypothetical protein